jgi:hypothetical protein
MSQNLLCTKNKNLPVECQYEFDAILHNGFCFMIVLFPLSLCSAALLDGVANIGAVEFGDLQLAAYLAERKPTGQPFFRNGECYIYSNLSLSLSLSLSNVSGYCFTLGICEYEMKT